VSRGAVADFARFRADHPLWTITRAGMDLRAFEARKGGVLVKAASLGELADRIRAADLHPPS
jgi:hypothetical protein